MKHLLTAIACFFALSMSAQFIPQPMGYNPDSNNDAFVGIDDLMAVLSLYGTPYDSGDSVEVVTLDFTGFENDTLSAPEAADIVYLFSGDSLTQYHDRYVLLPSSQSWNSIVFFGFSSFQEDAGFRLITNEPVIEQGTEEWPIREVAYLRAKNPEWSNSPMEYQLLLRNHFGHWTKANTP